MKESAVLAVTSLLSLLLLTLHITDDIVRGISKAESSNTALVVLVVFLYGTLVLAERRSGYVIMLLVGAKNLREISLFPMNQQALDLLMNAPSEVTPAQLRDLHIRLAPQAQKS